MYLSKPTEYRTPKVNANVNCGLRATMICQCRVINWNKCVTLVGDVDEDVQVRGQGLDGKSLYLPCNFAVNLKLLLKNIKSQF